MNTPILQEYAGQTKYHLVEWFQGHFRLAFVNVKAASTVMLTMYQSSTIALGWNYKTVYFSYKVIPKKGIKGFPV